VRAEAALADRRAAVRVAARRWRAASEIDEAQLAGIEAAYPDDRRRLGPVFRALVFAFSALGLVVEAGLLATLAGFALGIERVALLLGLQCAGLTEWQLGPLRRAQAGAEAATGFLAPVFVVVGTQWLLHQAGVPPETTLTLAWILAAALFAAATARWGIPLMATAAAGSLFLFLARFPWGRLAWVGLALAAGPFLLRASRSARLAPSHRRAASEAMIVSGVALLVAVNLWSLDLGLVELGRHWFSGIRVTPSSFARVLSAVATAGLPVALLLLGLRLRSRLLLALGALGVAAAIVTARAYWRIAPLWIVVTVGGMALIALALGLRRWFDGQPGREAGGFTVQPLFEDARRQRVIETAATVAVLGPGAGPAASPGTEGRGGGGEFGGGGATEKF
jgi:hypothetical protein